MYKSAIPVLKDKDGEFSEQPAVKKVRGGFAKVVAGGRIVRLQNEKPFLERMVTGNRPNTHSHLPRFNGCIGVYKGESGSWH